MTSCRQTHEIEGDDRSEKNPKDTLYICENLKGMTTMVQAVIYH
ncbi:MAG: hypothetical protein A4E37_00732 [Methanoregulaceae archaeon PtaB.Bin056]|jgi:hypothetical protein|nr:MAG: hypothetical protein A4E37_00732 [Methanoregulaceae archaeon PtaB.Bin056]